MLCCSDRYASQASADAFFRGFAGDGAWVRSMGIALAWPVADKSGKAADIWRKRCPQTKFEQNGGPRGSRFHPVPCTLRPRLRISVSSIITTNGSSSPSRPKTSRRAGANRARASNLCLSNSRYAADQSVNCWALAQSMPLTVRRPRPTRELVAKTRARSNVRSCIKAGLAWSNNRLKAPIIPAVFFSSLMAAPSAGATPGSPCPPRSWGPACQPLAASSMERLRRRRRLPSSRCPATARSSSTKTRRAAGTRRTHAAATGRAPA